MKANQARQMLQSKERFMNPENRPARRVRSAAASEPPARISSGVRTGTSAHFAAWKAEGAVKSVLQRMKTDKLADSLEDSPVAANGFALLYVAGFKNLWQVSQSDLHGLLDARGIDVQRLSAVEDYLTSKHVALNWSVNA